MMEVPTLVLATTAAGLLAADVPLPVELTALAMVGVILRFLLQRDDSAAKERDRRLDALEAERDEQRHLKHVVINQLAGITGSLALIKTAAERCTCGAVTPVMPLIDNLLSKENDNP